MPIKNFTQLDAWRSGHICVLKVYDLTKKFPKDELFGLTSQLRRAAVSITSNIAEGFGRYSLKEKCKYYFVSLGSLYETENQIILSRDLNYINIEEYQDLFEKLNSCERILNGLIKTTKSLKVL